MIEKREAQVLACHDFLVTRHERKKRPDWQDTQSIKKSGPTSSTFDCFAVECVLTEAKQNISAATVTAPADRRVHRDENQTA